MTTELDNKTDHMVRHVLVGTAGHIDHGKTSLVAALSQIDTDRLPEEKARGISIDLGFAHWESTVKSTEEPGESTLIQFGVVDVPGHERFVRNMVAGATGINLAVLVVAADDGVMPQTREHLEIMDLLGVQTGLVAITKIDLVEDDYVELVEAEIEELVAGSFLEGCPVIPVSSETGEGIDELREEITRIAVGTLWQSHDDYFRLPIDRIFTLTGHGTIVTGSALCGVVQPGDTLRLMPDERDVRVRDVENHGAHSTDSHARQRTAINLAGIKTDEIARGQELVTPGYFEPTRRIIVELRSLSSSSVVLKDRMELSLHLGTGDVVARLVLKGEQIKPGGRGYAELRLLEPIIASYGQRFILRRLSPASTVAGGIIFDPYVPQGRRLRDLSQMAEQLSDLLPRNRLDYFFSTRDEVDVHSENPSTSREACWKLGIRHVDFDTLVNQLKNEGRFAELKTGGDVKTIHAERLKEVSASVMRTIRHQLDQHQPRRTLPRSTLLSACSGIASTDLLNAILDHLIRNRELVRVQDRIGPTDAQVELSKKQRAARDQILQKITAGGIAPPTVKELSAERNLPVAEILTLANILQEDQILISVSESLFFTPESLDQAREICIAQFAENERLTLSQLREAWGITRKHAVPLCEFLDARGVTKRQENDRFPGPNLNVAFVLQSTDDQSTDN